MFNQETLLLINSMPISFDEVNKYINIMQNNEEFINKNKMKNIFFFKLIKKYLFKF